MAVLYTYDCYKKLFIFHDQFYHFQGFISWQSVVCKETKQAPLYSYILLWAKTQMAKYCVWAKIIKVLLKGWWQKYILNDAPK